MLSRDRQARLSDEFDKEFPDYKSFFRVTENVCHVGPRNEMQKGLTAGGRTVPLDINSRPEEVALSLSKTYRLCFFLPNVWRRLIIKD